MLTFNELEQLNKDVELILKELTPLKDKAKELELESGMEGFWDNLDYATSKTKELGELKARIAKLTEIEENYEYMLLLQEESNSTNYVDSAEVDKAQNDLFNLVNDFKREKLLSGKYDDLPAIITLHAGSGGTESCDFTQMIWRMLARWADIHKFSIKITDEQPDDVAGLKSATMILTGKHAYGYAKALSGIFRLVRISPFDAAGRRHTSFMAIEVIPEIKNDDTIIIKPEDIELQTMIAHVKAGGQNLQHNNMAVRITHKPTGIVIRYDAERSQLQNRNAAMELLKSKLAAIKQQEREAELSGIKGEKNDNGWGNSICSIVLMPYQLVKDNRTGWESGNTSNFLDGDLDDFINSYLEWANAQGINKND